MIPELGHFALILALLIALAQGVLPIPAIKKRTAILLFILNAAAFAALTWCYVVTDLTVANVAENSHTLKPLLYKFAGVWGNHEGSMLLWSLILSLFSMMVALSRQRDDDLISKTLSVQGLLSAGFLAFILFSSNPFRRIWPPPVDGAGLNPVLQDPGLAFPPPLLYMGYVGFSVAFAFAVAGLLTGKIDKNWARLVRPWILFAWTALSAGIALGSWWAYYELGWGGWWFWDPVENASLMPWLAGTALLHSVIVLEKRDTLKRWVALLAILTFSLSMLGTFLVRSGVLTSVHAFAVDPKRGLFILALLTLYTGGALALYAWKASALESKAKFSVLSRESALILNNLFMTTGCATVFIGTLYPLLAEALAETQISVGPPYFHATFIPLMIPALLLMGAGIFIPWKQGDLKSLTSRLKLPLFATLIGLLLVFFLSQSKMTGIYLGLGTALWLAVTTIAEFIQRTELKPARMKSLPLSGWGMSTAHLGLAIALFGMIGSTLLMQEKVALMKPGDTLSIGRYELKLDGVGATFGTNYAANTAAIELKADGRVIGALQPERRYYPVAQQGTTEAAIRKSWRDDIYVALGDEDAQKPGHYVVRAYMHPLVPYLWLGYALIALGGFLAFAGTKKQLPSLSS
ncbi:MAG TPA: heme lyase NrfEFG subunit NrfE [Rhodospirillaceae bacterium]|nr:heme lyase NrfEFG subunit NrfE [Rhodospirillaceae bacterium]